MNEDIGTKYKSKNGLIGVIESIQGVKRLIVRNNTGKITQTITLSKLDIKIFEVVE